MDGTDHHHHHHHTKDQEKPFVIRQTALKEWCCRFWTLGEWTENCQNETRFRFRVHRRRKSINIDAKTLENLDCKDKEGQSQIHWENEAIDYIEATMSQFVEHVSNHQDGKKIESKHKQEEEEATEETCDPFGKFTLKDYCFYSAYNYIDQVLDPKTRTILNDSFQWKKTGLFPDRDQSQSSFDSTLWIGTDGAYTPCHQDTYGYNFVAQLYGKKLWILFSPEETSNLYPTRIPFEESSIFSQIDLNYIDLDRYPRFAQVKPYIVVLDPGDLLYVPHHWWHYVENVCDTNPNNDHVSISVNTWINPLKNGSKDHLNECMTQLLFNSLFQTLDQDQTQKWLNINVELISTSELIQTLQHLIQNNDPNSISFESPRYEKPLDLQVDYLEESKFEDLARRKPMKLLANKNEKVERKSITTKDIVNCILDPDVIDLIVQKLKQKL